MRHIGIALDEDELVRLKDLAAVVKAKLEADTQPQLFPPEDVAEQVIAAQQHQDDSPPQGGPQAPPGKPSASSAASMRCTARCTSPWALTGCCPPGATGPPTEPCATSVMARLANPQSKRASVRVLEDDFGVRLSLEQVYRMMDLWDDDPHCPPEHPGRRAGQSPCWAGLCACCSSDCTTLYFESFTEDDLKQPGYSKDAKFKECQVVLAPGG